VREFEEDGPCLVHSNSGTVVRSSVFRNNRENRTTTLAGHAIPVGTNVCSFRKAALNMRAMKNRDLILVWVSRRFALH
jgi:hypothetical protein